MKRATIFAVMISLVGCAAQTSERAEKEDLAVRDFIEVRGLAEADEMRTSGRDSWRQVADRFLIYKARRDAYLVEFARPCYELNDNSAITPDVRADPNRIRARFDTIRGCRIHRLYPLTKDEAAELRDLGETPGNRN